MQTPIAITVAGALAAFAAWQLGGTEGAGVVAGYLCGASVSGLCLMRRRMVLRTRPDQLMRVMAESFLFKLSMVMMGALAFRFVDAAAARVDWRSFLVSYAASVVLVVGADTLASWMRGELARPRAAQSPDSLEELKAL